MLLSFWMPLVISLVLWCSFEQLLIPRPRSWFKRPGFATAIDVGTWAALYGGFTLLLERSWFAMVIMGALHMVIVQVSNTKANTLREPFLCQDFEYFVDMVKHPRMYIPFFGIGLTIASSLAGVAAIIAGFWLEPSLFFSKGAGAFAIVLGVTLVGLVVLTAGLKKAQPVPEEADGTPLDPNDELVRFGLTTLIWRQGKELFTPLDNTVGRKEFKSPELPTIANKGDLPHLVVVQSESFFDPRRWYSGIREDVLAQWDAIAAEAEQRGQLDVPVWGANTVRSECAFLTGLSGGALGGHRFNPYHALSKKDVPTLLTPLKQLGYRCIAIHPYPVSFYLRDKVFPRFGFDEFIDLESFAENQKDGQYTSDLALADKVDSLIASSEQPMVIMLITMENHGPLHLEQPQASAEKWYSKKPEPASSDLTVYLRHLHNSGLMVERLSKTLTACSKGEESQIESQVAKQETAGLSENSSQPLHAKSDKNRHAIKRDGILCFYGDHVPIMASTYKTLGYPDGLTEYFIWSTNGEKHESPATAHLEDLGVCVLNHVLSKASGRDESHSSRRPEDDSTTQQHFKTEKY